MRQHSGWWFPDNDATDIPQWMLQINRRVDGRLTYQYHKYEYAFGHCQQWRMAVDVGAHVGLWSYWMARDFRQVYAFEPDRPCNEAWHVNMATYPHDNAVLYPVALGNGCAQTICLDDYALQEVDLLKIDTDGGDADIIEGALDTIARCRPVIIVEQKPGCGARYGRGDTDAVPLLEGLGATYKFNLGGDYIFAFV